MSVGEILTLLKKQNLSPDPWSAYAGSLLVSFAACVPIIWILAGADYPPDCPLGKLGWPLSALAVGVFLAFLAEIVRYKEPGGMIVRIALAVWIMAYIGLSMTFLALLRQFHSHAWGMAALISVIVVVKMSDVGAYTFGRLLGRRKMAPRLSPGKTIEGAVGGIATACVASWLFFAWVAPLIVGGNQAIGPWWGWLLYGFILAVAGMVGDLAESLLKRDMQSKDSSSWMPGLGGVLDVVDSLLIAAAPAYMCWILGWVGPLSG